MAAWDAVGGADHLHDALVTLQACGLEHDHCRSVLREAFALEDVAIEMM